jgi:hypothetical protein
MDKCEWCEGEIGYTKFTAIVGGIQKNLCRDCFMQHVNEEDEEKVSEKAGMSYEVISRLFVID